MKKLIILTALFCVVFQSDSFGCRKKKRKKAKESTTQTTNSESKSSSILIVSFISTGSGIDFRTVPEFEKDLKSFNISNSCSVIYEIKNWGREGERDYCITSKDAKCLAAYTEHIKSAFKSNERILIKENGICRE
jgi:hypothetical protein